MFLKEYLSFMTLVNGRNPVMKKQKFRAAKIKNYRNTNDK
ncbi:hypothetical protein BTN49_1053 [Candidatus Enterovibrio escicola]|uniref:Uncharacterized protein n=1 Tax=Candidatus Enterovibrio escicola TaxID=1927127 RepID=A0A2A5T4I8_9GAMM|nr:hypothetical protein BTN49_1053 [Candidatus Enterovibrio escacola]